jgi:hypothetical protein
MRMVEVADDEDEAVDDEDEVTDDELKQMLRFTMKLPQLEVLV